MLLWEGIEFLGVVRIKSFEAFLCGANDIEGEIIERVTGKIRDCRTILALAEQNEGGFILQTSLVAMVARAEFFQSSQITFFG